MQNTDIIISGGGMVGAALALALSQAGLTVSLIEKHAPAPFAAQSEIDLRVSSLNLRSERWLQQLGAWQALAAMRLCPYQYLQAGEAKASVRFDAADIAEDHLGHIVENNLVQLALWQQFNRHVTVITDTQISAVQENDTAVQVTLADGQQLSGALLIGADGANSVVRQFAGIGTQGWQYQQACLVAYVDTPYPQQDITWQQFYPSGPRAFLPLPGARASLVWYDEAAKVKQLAQLAPAALEHAFITAFPAELGAVKLKASAWFPLARMHAQHYVKGRCVLAGDAAHTINPLAGQGVNLGFADAMLLADTLIENQQAGRDLADNASLKQYQRQRKLQNTLMMSAMDAIYQTFSRDSDTLSFIRQQGLRLAANAGPAKRLLTKYAVGNGVF
ncbi:FAD-dependent monooxygenase [Alishewanella sp. 16-MA]|uniref:FAD-dependent monooxygenase n=2 Tax=Gammaproteobacteria TaxID=1236 RepID=A0ABS8BZW4_9ALTE|nr:FAD-dependent monooxygenase [Alishewanella maricola]MCB5225597.1 FAD-dependent monooxygenase [Alishewanella maricola]MDP5035724.1 FAD-dependent monooxygenase [Alishewanella sp.]MDP5187546.1 FAD-dependent monooxygenase [Alishewanella sp.]